MATTEVEAQEKQKSNENLKIKESTMTNKKEIKIDQLTRSNKVLIRSKINADHLERFKEDRTRGDIFPPVQAVYDGKNYWLYDGNHRVQAELANGNTSIWVDITEGTFRDAMLLSFGANADHGVGRSNQDKRNAVTKCLLDEEWGQWSAGMIADICRVSQAFVSKLRKESTQNGFELTSATRGKDGKIRNTDKIGKKQGPTVPEPVLNEESESGEEDTNTNGPEIIEENGDTPEDTDNSANVDIKNEDDPEDDPEIASDAATNNGDTVSNDTENSDLDAIDDVDILKSMIIQLRKDNKKQDDEVIDLKKYVKELEGDVHYLEMEVEAKANAKERTGISSFPDNTPVNEEQTYSMA